MGHSPVTHSIWGVIFVLHVLTSCSTSLKIKRSPVFQNSHTGFVLYDLEKRKLVDEFNGSKYFTPASNTKILTLWAGLKILGDSVPALRYQKKGDSILISGTGDPTFLNPAFGLGPAYNFLDQWTGQIYFAAPFWEDERFGPGWAWDDFPSSYSAEKSAFPIYGNTIRIAKAEGETDITIMPSFFANKLTRRLADSSAAPLSRAEFQNQYEYHPQPSQETLEVEMPFVYSDTLLVELLSDTLGRPVHYLNSHLDSDYGLILGHPMDSLYQTMMQQSDNFIAEQILILCSSLLSDTLSSKISIDYMMERWLGDLPDKPRWVDGSGLSRYNLITPRSTVRLWEKIYDSVPRKRLFSLLAQGGQQGTLKYWYKSDPPFIFGKTGTLSNNHCLSGFLVTSKGKTYIFSFMNTHYMRRTEEIKLEMQSLLNEIYLTR